MQILSKQLSHYSKVLVFSMGLRIGLGCVWLLMLGSAGNVLADSATWNGFTGTLWSDLSNWNIGPGAVPGTGNTATFSSAGNGNTTIDLGAGVTLGTLLFDTSTAAAYTIGLGAVNSQTLTLNDSGAITVNATVVANELIQAALVLGLDATAQNYTIANNSTTNSLTLAGTITGGSSGTAGAKTLNLFSAAGGNLILNGVIGQGGASSLPLVKTGSGILELNAANTYTGITTISAGTVKLGNAAGLGSSAAATDHTVVAAGATLDLNGLTIAESFGRGGATLALDGFGGATAVLTNSSSTAAAITGTINFDGAGAFTVNGTGDITLTRAARTNGTSGDVMLTKDGSNTLILAGTADNGALSLTVNAGTVQLNKGGSGVRAVGGTTTTIGATGTIKLTAGQTNLDQIYQNTNVVNNGIFDLNGQNESFNAMTGTGIVTNTATNDAAVLTLGENSGSFTWAGVIQDGVGTSTVGLTKMNSGTMTVTNNNTYTGATTLSNFGGTMALDFAAAGGTNDNLLSAASSLVMTNASSSRVQIFSIIGEAGVTNNQAFTSTSVTGAGLLHRIVVTSGAGGTANLALGALSFTNSPYLDFVLPTSGSITTTNADGLLGPRITINNGSAWAQVLSGQITTFSGDLIYQTGINIGSLPTYTTAGNLLVDNTSTGNVLQASATTQLNTVQFTDTADRLLTLGAGNKLQLGATGGLLRSATAGSVTIGELGNAGTLTTGTASGADLILTNGNAAGALTVNSVIANNAGGAVDVFVNGNAAATTILTGANTYTGTTTVQTGALRIANSAALGTVAGGTSVVENAALELSGDITVGDALSVFGTGVGGNGALRNVSGTNTYSGLVTLPGAAEIQADTGSTLIFDRAGTATAVTTASSITLETVGTGVITFNDALVTTGTANPTITKTGTGTLNLNASNAWAGTGNLTINDGVVQISNGGALGGTTGNTTVTDNAALQLIGGITTNETITLLNSTGISGGGALRNISGNNTITGNVIIDDGTGRINSDAGTLTISGELRGDPTSASAARNVTLGGAGDIVVSGIARNGTGTSPGVLSVTKDGTGTATLSGANTYTGATVVSAGTLVLSGTSSATSSVSINGGTSTTLLVTNPGATGAGLINIATGAITPNVLLHIDGGGAINLANALGGNSGITTNIDVNNNGSGTNGVISLNGSSALSSIGTITLNITGGNGYSLNLANLRSTAGAAGVTTFNPTTAAVTIGNITGTQATGTNTWTLSGTNTGNAVTGVISDSSAGAKSAVNKIGTSTWDLDGANTYTGATTVNGGVLNLDGSISGSAITVASAGTFNVNATGALTGASSLTVRGTTQLSGTNTTTGTTTLNNGTLNLNYDTAAGGTDTSKLADAGVLTLSGGTLNLIGGTHLEQVGSTTLTAGTTTNINRVSGSTVLALGAITPGSGSLVNFSANNIASTTTANTGGILGGWATVTIGGVTEWATNSGISDGGTGGLITAYTGGYTDITRLSSGTKIIPDSAVDNVRIIEGTGTVGEITLAAAATEINTLKMEATGGPATINPGTTEVLTIGGDSGGGIIQTATAGALTIGTVASDGVLTTGGTANTTPAVLAFVNDSTTNDLTINSIIANNSSDVVGLAKSGDGRVVLNGANTFSGSVNIDAGTLFVGAVTGASTTGTLGASTAVTNNGALVFRRTSVGAVDVAGAISGTGSVQYIGTSPTVSGAVDYTVNNASTYSGGTTISGNARVATTSSTGLGSGAVEVQNGASLMLNGNINVANNLTISGNGWLEGAGNLGALRLGTATSSATVSGTVTLAGDSRITATTPTGTPTGTISGAISGAYNMEFGEDSATGVVSLTGNNINYTGTTTVNYGTLNVGNANALGTTANGTVVNGLTSGATGYGTQIRLGANITVANEALSLTGATNTRSSLTVSAVGTSTWAGNIALTGAGLKAFGVDTAGAILNIGTDAADTVTGTDSPLTLRGSGAVGYVKSTLDLGTGLLSKTDSSTWYIESTANTYTGDTIISQGILSFGNIANSGLTSSIGSGSGITLGQNQAGSAGVGTMQFTGATGGSSDRSILIMNGTTGGGGIIENTVAGQTLTLSGAISTQTPGSASTLTVQGAGDTVLSGSITGAPALALTKLGSGTSVLSGASNTSSGTTTVTSGALQVGVAGVGQTGSGAVTVQTGAALLGTGTVQGSSFTASSGASVFAGDSQALGSIGSLTFAPTSGAGAFDFQAGSNTYLGLTTSGSSDLLNFVGSGSLLMNGNLTVGPSTLLPTAPQVFNLLDWAGLATTFDSRFSSGSYATSTLFGNGDDNLGFNLPDVYGSGYAWDISSFTTNGTIALVAAVPEVSRTVLLMLGLFVTSLRRRRSL